MTPRIEFSNNTIILNGNKSSLFSRIVLLVLISICFLAVIIKTLVAINNLDFSPIIITYLIVGLPGLLLLRIYLWNTYGKEIIVLEGKQLVYQADYRYFKSEKKEIPSDNLQLYIIDNVNQKPLIGRLNMVNDSINIQSVIDLPKVEIEVLIYKIRQQYKLK